MTDTACMDQTKAAAAFLIEARPGDALEAMLVVQMAAVHDAAMRCLSRAAEVAAEHPEIEARYLREAARLLHLFQRQSDALDRRRIAAEDRRAERGRAARIAAKDWQREAAEARRWGRRPPPRPHPPAPAWPAWPAPAAAGKDGGGKANGRAAEVAEGRAAAAGNGRPTAGRRLN